MSTSKSVCSSIMVRPARSPSITRPRRFAALIFVIAALTGVFVSAPAMAKRGTPPPRAKLAMYLPSSAIAQTSSAWSLAKSGAVDQAAGTVTWQITASAAGAATKTLTVTGRITLLNVGNTPAPIGNIVVKLDAKNGNGWTTVAANVATATAGDAATSAKLIDPSDGDADEDYDDANPWMTVRTIAEGPGSGALTFTQGSTPWSLSPKQSIAPWSTLELRFTATFNNSMLNLATGKPVRAEIVVTSGNAGSGPRTVANVDIDGSGNLSADEARVRSKARRLGHKTVPAPTPISSPVAISDTTADITTTGTVTFSNPVFTLGATTGTVSVNYDAGDEGGTITNCAHLTGSGVNLTKCNEQKINVEVGSCVKPGAAGCGWEDGEVVSYAHGEWGSPGTTASPLLTQHFTTLYEVTLLNVGVLGAAGFSLTLTSAATALAYLPDTGTPGVLTADIADPASSSAGSFASNLVALTLNIDFAEAGYLQGSSGLGVGDLTLCGVGMGLDGSTVSDFLGNANAVVAGSSSSLTPAAATTLAAQINNAFTDGFPSTFAQEHLVNGACPPHQWADGEVVSYGHGDWGDSLGDGGQLLASGFDAIYGSGNLAVGLPGAAGFSISLSDAASAIAYLPDNGVPGVLTSDISDPSFTVSGALGSNLTALALNIDYSGAGLLLGSAGLGVGDLTLCSVGFGQDGQSVSAFLSAANTLLGGGASSLTPVDATNLAAQINAAFIDGVPSAFAQDHLVNGSCN